VSRLNRLETFFRKPSCDFFFLLVVILLFRYCGSTGTERERERERERGGERGRERGGRGGKGRKKETDEQTERCSISPSVRVPQIRPRRGACSGTVSFFPSHTHGTAQHKVVERSTLMNNASRLRGVARTTRGGLARCRERARVPVASGGKGELRAPMPNAGEPSITWIISIVKFARIAANVASVESSAHRR
jgi:hypothetical protein